MRRLLNFFGEGFANGGTLVQVQYRASEVNDGSCPEKLVHLSVVLEAQMASDPGFLLGLYAETGRFLQQHAWSHDWCVVVICPHLGLDFVS